MMGHGFVPCLISAFFSSNLSCCPVQKQNNWVGCNCPFQGLQSKTHSPFQGTCCPCQGFSFFGFGLCLLATCHHLHPGSAITFSFFFTVALLYWLWQRPGSLLATSFALAFSCFCFGPSSFHWCRPCWLLRALSGLLLFTAAAAGGAGLLLFGVGLLLFGTCQVKKNDVGIFVQSRPHFFCDKTWIQKMAKNIQCRSSDSTPPWPSGCGSLLSCWPGQAAKFGM